MGHRDDLTIWLGGPGTRDKLSFTCLLIAEFLARNGFTVISNCAGSAPNPRFEFEAAKKARLAFLVAVSPGASAEAVEFAHDGPLRSKLHVYVPEEYADRYVFKLLSSYRYKVTDYSRVFSLKKLNEHDPELALQILEVAVDKASEGFRGKSLRLNFRSPF